MINRTLTLVAATLAIAGFAGAASAEQGQAAQARYEAVVLGNDVAHTGVQIVPQASHGAYATYLIRNGETESAAVAQAARAGTQTTYRVVPAASTQLSSIQLHDKLLGRTPFVASSQTVASAL